MSKSNEADAAAFAALCLAETMFQGMIRGGMLPRAEALQVLDGLAAKIAERSPAHASAADELLRFKDELAAKTLAN